MRSTERNQVERRHAEELKKVSEEAAAKQERLQIELDGVKRVLADKHEELRSTSAGEIKLDLFFTLAMSLGFVASFMFSH